MKTQKGALGVERLFIVFIAIVIVAIIIGLLAILKFCSFGVKAPLSFKIHFTSKLPGAAPMCGGFTLDVKGNYEIYQEIPFKANFALYTFLKTKTDIAVDACLKYIDCAIDTSEAICKKFYGSNFEKKKCEELITKTLENIWERKVKITITSANGKNITFTANRDKYETINPLYTIQRKIFIPYPSRTITLTFEVW